MNLNEIIMNISKRELVTAISLAVF